MAPPEWLEALAPLGTDEHKPYVDTAQWLIAVFAQLWGVGGVLAANASGPRDRNLGAVFVTGDRVLAHTGGRVDLPAGAADGPVAMLRGRLRDALDPRGVFALGAHVG